MRNHRLWLTLLLMATCSPVARGQLAPGIGYMHPAGGEAGQTIEVLLGGYDWTPDMQVFVLDPRIQLEILDAPGPVIVPEPPYWFGGAVRRAFLLPRETRARLTIPADTPPGIVHWQAANANGATSRGRFIVGQDPEMIERSGRKGPQDIPALPVTISGQITKIEEVDQFRFTATQTGPVSCNVVTHGLKSPLNAVIQVHTADGQLVADTVDTEGRDCSLTFTGKAGHHYIASVHDVSFRGNRSFVYRLTLTQGPRVVAAIPVAGRRGVTRMVEFIGVGVASGEPVLESTTREVTFPTDAQATSFRYQLETRYGTAPSYELFLSDLPQTTEPVAQDSDAHPLNLPAAITGTIEGTVPEDRYQFDGKKDDVWQLSLEAARHGSPLDMTLSIHDPEGKQLAENDDLPETTDAGLQFTVPADGTYQVTVADLSGQQGHRGLTYRLVINQYLPDFTLSLPELLNVPLGGKGSLEVKATLVSGFNEPIAISIAGLPEGISAAEELLIPAGKTSLAVELTAAPDAAAGASLVTVHGTATLAENKLTRPAGQALLASTMKPPFSIEGERRNDVTKWPRGTTFPSPVLIERDEGFDDPLVLEMASGQSYHRMGITGPELPVPAGATRVLYPIFLPEWLQTSTTGRMVVNAVARLPDPQGNVRYVVSRLKDRLGFLPVGALLKISSEVEELQVTQGEAFEIPLTIHRALQLLEPTRLELRTDETTEGLLSAEAVQLPSQQNSTQFRVTAGTHADLAGLHELTVRATVLKDGKYPVVAETRVLVLISPR